MTVSDVHTALRRLGGFYDVYVPEFTFGAYRIDAAIIDVSTRWIRGFEVKMNRSDFLRDEKWVRYAEFCSSLSVVCPEGMIDSKEVPKPFGLLYVLDDKTLTENLCIRSVRWVNKPKRYQRRDGLAWTFQYLKVIEKELPRLSMEVSRLSNRVLMLEKQHQEGGDAQGK